MEFLKHIANSHVKLNSKHSDLIAHGKTAKHLTSSIHIKQTTLPLKTVISSFNEEVARSEYRCAMFVACHSAILISR